MILYESVLNHDFVLPSSKDQNRDIVADKQEVSLSKVHRCSIVSKLSELDALNCDQKMVNGIVVKDFFLRGLVRIEFRRLQYNFTFVPIEKDIIKFTSFERHDNSS